MTRERLFRHRDDAAFDWLRIARELAAPVEQARGLYARALRTAGDDADRAEQLYRRWLRDAVATKQAAPLPVPGRTTRVMQERQPADRSRLPLAGAPGVPGRTTLTSNAGTFEPAVEPTQPEPMQPEPVQPEGPASSGLTDWADQLREHILAVVAAGHGVAEVLAAAEPAKVTATLRALADVPVPGQAMPLLRLIGRADDGAAARVVARGSSGVQLPGELVARLTPHVGGAAVRAARLHTDDAADLVAAAHHAHAVTLGDDVYFARGAYAPGTAGGDELLTHELTHVAQGQRGALSRAAAKGIESGGTLDPAEAEAELAGKLAVIQLRPSEPPPPPLAQPTAQPTTDGDRQAQLAAQQQRLALVGRDAAPEPPAQAPATSSPQAAVAHPPPVMAAPPRPASSGNAYVDTFDAPPSKQALQLWSQAGEHATTQVAADQAKFTSELAPMPVALDGGDLKAAKGGARPHSPKAAPAPGNVPPQAQPTPTPAPPPVTAGASIAQAVKPIADKAQLKADGEQAIDSLPSTMPDVKTDPGPAPVTDLAGQADPVRAIGDQQHASSEGAQALGAEKAKVLAGPGAAQVQPIKLAEQLEVPAEQPAGAMPALPTVDGMTKLKKWNLPSNAQDAFDAEAKPRMAASLAQAKAKMTEAQSRRDADRDKVVADSQDKVKQAHVDADKQQQTKIAETRTQIANHQADTLTKQEAEVQKLDQQAGDRKKATVGKINDRIQADQTKVESDYKSAQQKAEDQKKQGEADAAKKKQDAQNKKKDEHWWDRAADAVCDGIKAIADEIDKALDAVCKAIGALLDAVKDAACKVIDAARDFVCQALTELGDWLKSAVTALIGSVFPELAAALDRLIDQAINAAKAAVNAIADGLKKAVSALCNALKGAIDAVIAAFKAAVAAAATFAQALITGDWKLVGKMILDGILKMLGIDPAAFYALIGELEDSIEKILENPGAFVGHLIDASKLGFKQFGQHFWEHLKDGVVQWLFGTMAGAGVHLVGRFDVAGVFDLVAQILGLTPQRLHARVAKTVGEQNAARFDFVASYIQGLVMSGRFDHLWEQIQQDANGLWDVVIGGVRQFLIEKVVQQAILKIATMWNPAGALVQAIETAWNVYQWLKMNSARIFGLVKAVVDSISNIVAGNITVAANMIENALARLVPIAIALLADLIGLTGLADKITEIVRKVETMIQNAIDKLIKKVMGMFKGRGGKDAEPGKGPNDNKDKTKDGEQPEVPKSLVEPDVAKVGDLPPALEIALDGAAAGGAPIYQAGNRDPKLVTEQLLAQHHNAHFNDRTAQLTLPPVQPSALREAQTLPQLGQQLAHQTGVSAIELHPIDEGHVELIGSINPRATLAQLAVNTRYLDARQYYKSHTALEGFAVNDMTVGGVTVRGLKTTIGLSETQTREYLEEWLKTDKVREISPPGSRPKVYHFKPWPTADDLLVPSLHPEYPAWMAGCARIPIPAADAERDWELLIVGLRDGKDDNFVLVANSIMRNLNVPRSKGALWSGGEDLSQYAKTQGCTTMEQQDFYRATQGLVLVDDWPVAKKAWKAFSSLYASHMRGLVHVYMRKFAPSSIMVATELQKIDEMLKAPGGVPGGLSVRYHAMEWGDDPNQVLTEPLLGYWRELDPAGNPLREGGVLEQDQAPAIHAVEVAEKRFDDAQKRKVSP